MLNREEKTKIRWLLEAWWRYLQARWGYSPAIYSWELLNEGVPDSTLHYILTDEYCYIIPALCYRGDGGVPLSPIVCLLVFIICIETIAILSRIIMSIASLPIPVGTGRGMRGATGGV